MLAYGKVTDAIGEYVRMGESTCIEAMERFAYAVFKVFGKEYLREPNAEDTERLRALGEAKGFPGMLDSVDCMHLLEICPRGNNKKCFYHISVFMIYVYFPCYNCINRKHNTCVVA